MADDHSTAFISYSWDSDEHKKWVRELATRLRKDGVDVRLDQWETVPGDQLPKFMEEAIRENNYVLIVSTPRYKARSDDREGGVGYEGDIITAEVLTTQNQRKFIPVLREGPWKRAAPSWAIGKYYVDLSGNPYSEEQYNDLLGTILKTRPSAPPLGSPAKDRARLNLENEPTISRRPESKTPTQESSVEVEEVKIQGIIVDEVTEPRLDGTPGSALYAVPFQLNRVPPPGWARIFLATWDHPPLFTTMHRPGIARVSRDRIILDGTTIEEVADVHRDTLILCVDVANKALAEHAEQQARKERERRLLSQEHSKRVEDFSKDINFDD